MFSFGSKVVSRVLCSTNRSSSILPLCRQKGHATLPESWTGRPILSYAVLHRIGFTWPVCYQTAGALLPHRSTLTSRKRRFISVALSLKSPSPAVSRYPALRCPDFPQTAPFGDPLAMIHFTPLCYYKPFPCLWQGLPLTKMPIISHTFGNKKFRFGESLF